MLYQAESRSERLCREIAKSYLLRLTAVAYLLSFFHSRWAAIAFNERQVPTPRIGAVIVDFRSSKADCEGDLRKNQTRRLVGDLPFTPASRTYIIMNGFPLSGH